MISKVFVDRPRLAVVIAIVMTIAGLVSLRQIPVAQFPDIVPPQVSVTANFPGASAEVVEATIAQPIESQVNGVDNMIYMRSTSGNDGSYTLTVSFRVGTDPDRRGADALRGNEQGRQMDMRVPGTVQKKDRSDHALAVAHLAHSCVLHPACIRGGSCPPSQRRRQAGISAPTKA